MMKVVLEGEVPLVDARPYQKLISDAARIIAATVEQVENPANGAHSLSAFAHGARIAEMKAWLAEVCGNDK